MQIVKHFLLKPGLRFVMIRLVGIFLIVEFIFMLFNIQSGGENDWIVMCVIVLLFIGGGVCVLFYSTVSPLLKFRKFVNQLSILERERFLLELKYDPQMRIWHTEQYVISMMLIPVKITEIFWVYPYQNTTRYMGIPIMVLSGIRVYTNDCHSEDFKKKKNNIQPFLQFILSHGVTPLIGYTAENDSAYQKRWRESLGIKV